MPVRKYRSVNDMPDVRPLPRLDPENLRIACELTELAFKLRPWKFEPGVRKFRSQAEAAQHRQEWEKMQVRHARGSSLTSYEAPSPAQRSSQPAGSGSKPAPGCRTRPRRLRTA